MTSLKTSAKARKLIATKNWAETPLGAQATWPEALRVAVSLMLDSQFPMFISWGPERIFLYNDAYAPILGDKLPRAMGQPFPVVWSDIWDDLLPLIKSVDQGQAVYFEDLRLIMNRSGYDEETFFTFSYSPITNTSNEVRGLLCTCVETTQKVKSERALQIAETKLKSERNRLLNILENFPEPITLISVPDMTFEFTNAKYREFYVNNQNVVGKKIAEVLPEGEEQGFVEILEGVYRTGMAFRGNGYPVELTTADGKPRSLVLNIVYEPIRGADGQVEAILAGNFDVTELHKAKEKAEIANISKTTFLANMSHEIRTPMNAVLGFTEILRDPSITDSQKQDAIERIDKSGRSLLKIIDDILDISKVESGKISIEKIPFSPRELVEEVLSLLSLHAEQKGVTVRYFIDSSIPDLASSDPARVRQIITNLVGNSIKFTSAGSVTLLASAVVEPSGNEYLIFKVVDTGIGIASEDHTKIFEPFAQADETISRKFGGTGLGLALSKRLAEQLGGSLSLESSELGKGSQFKVQIEAGPFFQRNLHESVSGVQKSFQAVVPQANLQSVRILVVDDVQDNQVLMRRYLESAGAHVEVAGNGQEAIEKILSAGETFYDVTLMDIQMPIVDGIQATKQLRSMGYRKPIIALTAHAMKVEVDRSLAAGCDEHLSKPIGRKALLEAVSRFVSNPLDNR